MKVKLYENVTTELVPLLKNLGHDVHTAAEEGLAGKSDSEIWHASQSEQRLLITQDLDFSDIRTRVPGEHSGILLLRLQSPSQLSIVTRVAELFGGENPETWIGCLVIATESKIRVTRP